MKKTLEFIWTYLKDWKNWLAHALVGVAILAMGLYLPVKPVFRLIILMVIIILNTLRMKLSEQNKTLSEDIPKN